MTSTERRTVNVEKMRHQLARADEHAPDAARRQWLATLTPLHRARHEGNPNMACLTCLADGIDRAVKLVCEVFRSRPVPPSQADVIRWPVMDVPPLRLNPMLGDPS